jgi:hypothetical protein
MQGMSSLSLLEPLNRPPIKTPQELVHIKHRITLLQYKYWILMLRAYREAFEAGGEVSGEDGYCYLAMDELATHLGYQPKTAEIEQDLEAIRKEPIFLNVLQKDGQKGKTGRGFIHEWYVSSNRVGVIFPPVIRQAIENLGTKDSIFHALNWAVFNSFTGKYEAVLYKLCKDYEGTGRTPYFPLDDFRSYMGIKETEYPDFKRLNQWVISGPIKRINESEISDISLEPMFKREVRKIVGVWFKVTPKKQTVMDFGDDPAFRFAQVSVALPQQRIYLAQKGAELVELSIQRANEYAEEQEKSGKKVNHGALYRKAIEEDWGQEYQAKRAKEAKKQAVQVEEKSKADAASLSARMEELKADYFRHLRNDAVKAMSEVQRREQAQIYIANEGATRSNSFDADTGQFTNKIESIHFNIWLRAAYKPVFDEVAFRTWVQSRNSTSR